MKEGWNRKRRATHLCAVHELLQAEPVIPLVGLEVSFGGRRVEVGGGRGVAPAAVDEVVEDHGWKEGAGLEVLAGGGRGSRGEGGNWVAVRGGKPVVILHVTPHKRVQSEEVSKGLLFMAHAREATLPRCRVLGGTREGRVEGGGGGRRSRGEDSTTKEATTRRDSRLTGYARVMNTRIRVAVARARARAKDGDVVFING